MWTNKSIQIYYLFSLCVCVSVRERSVCVWGGGGGEWEGVLNALKLSPQTRQWSP